jgi:hypothetical protein
LNTQLGYKYTGTIANNTDNISTITVQYAGVYIVSFGIYASLSSFPGTGALTFNVSTLPNANIGFGQVYQPGNIYSTCTHVATLTANQSVRITVYFVPSGNTFTVDTSVNSFFHITRIA